MTDEQDDTPESVVWVRTEPDLDGTFRTKIEFDDDHAEFLDHEQVLLWAEYVLIQCARAAFDGKVLRQLDHGSPQAALEVLQAMRKDRITALSPLKATIDVGVTKNGKGFLKIKPDGENIVGQWELAQGRSHAVALIEAVHTADLDNAYRIVLTGLVGLDDDTARRAIDGLSTYAD